MKKNFPNQIIVKFRKNRIGFRTKFNYNASIYIYFKLNFQHVILFSLEIIT